MSTLTTPTTRATTRMRIGLVLTVLLALGNLPFLLQPTPAGEDGPPYSVIVLGAVLALVSVVAAVVAWPNWHRTAVRVASACVIVNAITSLPAFFVEVAAEVKIGVAVTVLISVLAVVLMLSPAGRSVEVSARAAR